MKTTPSLSSKMIPALVILVLLLTAVACRFGGGQNPPAAAATAPAGEQEPAQEITGQDDRTNEPQAHPDGDTDLADPSTGLDALSNYHQVYTETLSGSLDGSPYEETRRVERQVAGEDESVQVDESVTGGSPLYFYTALLSGYHYAQDREGSSCRAEPVEAYEPVDQNPAVWLPVAYGLHETGQEELDGQAAIHYTFDEQSLNNPDGVLEGASGEVWLAGEDGLVLKYELEVELSSPQFTGTRTYSYTLDQVDGGQPIHLPAACQPVLADLPALPGAQDLEVQPGFQHYFVDASREEAVAFYNEQLPSGGWQALPGSAPEKADFSLDVTVLSFTRAYLEGGQVLVIQLGEQEGQLRVIAQTVNTSQPVKILTGTDAAVPPEDNEGEEIEEAPDLEPPSGGSALPSDLPEYPGAKQIAAFESVIMLETSDEVKDVAKFYTDALTSSGWTIENNVEAAGVISQTWLRGSESLVVSIMPNGSVTSINIAALGQ